MSERYYDQERAAREDHVRGERRRHEPADSPYSREYERLDREGRAGSQTSTADGGGSTDGSEVVGWLFLGPFIAGWAALRWIFRDFWRLAKRMFMAPVRAPRACLFIVLLHMPAVVWLTWRALQSGPDTFNPLPLGLAITAFVALFGGAGFYAMMSETKWIPRIRGAVGFLAALVLALWLDFSVFVQPLLQGW